MHSLASIPGSAASLQGTCSACVWAARVGGQHASPHLPQRPRSVRAVRQPCGCRSHPLEAARAAAWACARLPRRRCRLPKGGAGPAGEQTCIKDDRQAYCAKGLPHFAEDNRQPRYATPLNYMQRVQGLPAFLRRTKPMATPTHRYAAICSHTVNPLHRQTQS